MQSNESSYAGEGARMVLPHCLNIARDAAVIGALVCAFVACNPEGRFEAISVPADQNWPPPGWVQQNPRSVETLTAIRFRSAHLGWAVGTRGAIESTADGGKTWHSHPSGTDKHLNSLTFVSDEEGWTVGEASTILHTTDGGQTWVRQSVFEGFEGNAFSPQDLHFHHVQFLNSQRGWAVGWTFVTEANVTTRRAGAILGTTNGGKTWRLQHSETREMVGEIRSLWFLTESMGWAVGDNGKVFQTKDGGLRWDEIQKIPNVYLTDVTFTDYDHGWVLANSGYQGQILSTVDGGKTWQPQTTSGYRTLARLVFINSATGWAVGAKGTILRTLDGGRIWEVQTSTDQDLYDVYFLDALKGWCIGRSGVLLKTTDGGASWVTEGQPTVQTLRGVAFVDQSAGWAVGDKGTILATADGGMHWRRQVSNIDKDLAAVAFASATHGWAVGEKGTILATKDGGATWEKQQSGIGEAFNGVSFVSPRQGWVVGTHGAILTTTDSGTNWQILNRGGGSQPFPDWNNFFAVTFLNANTGWAVGHTGMIMATRDGGHSWEEQYGHSKRGNVGFLFDVSFPTPKVGWAVGWQMLGGQSVIMTTSNGGKTWEFQSGASVHSGHSGILRGVTFVDRKTGWVVGGQGTILKTVNGGRVWTRRVPAGNFSNHAHSYHYGPELHAVTFTDPKTGWIVGDNGTILHTTSGGE